MNEHSTESSDDGAVRRSTAEDADRSEAGGDSALSEAVALTLFAVALGNAVALGFGAGYAETGGDLSALGGVAVSIGSLQVVGMLGTALAYLRFRGRWDLLRVRRPSARTLGLVVAGFLAAFVVNLVRSAATVALELEAATPVTAVGTGADDPAFVLLVLVAVSFLVVAPVEELLFRGVIQGRLREERGPWLAVVIASALFALMHLPGLTGSISGRLVVLLGLFAVSVVFGWLYERTGNLLVPWAVHGLYNASLFGLLYLLVVAGAV